MKRIISLLLALALCLSLGMPALAAGGEGPAFEDVREGDWYYDAVQWAVKENVTQGMSETQFGAASKVTRAMMVTFLWRMAGSPEPASSSGFSDVPEGEWYSDAVNWAAEQGIANGMSRTTFVPAGKLTREQAATFLYREEQRRGGGFTGMWVYPLDYSDADEVSDWAFEPLCWMTMQGVINGDNGALKPKRFSSRAEVVTMLWRYAEKRQAPQTAEEQIAFTEREVPVLRDSLDSDETATLRFYEDMPNVPYMELKKYYDAFCLLGTDLTEGLTETRTGSRFHLTNPGGHTAEANVEADTITTDHLEAFTALAYDLLLEVNGEIDENYPFLKEIHNPPVPEEPRPVTLRLGDYGIDLRGGEDGLYLPLATLSDVFSGTNLCYTVYNGEKIYLVDYFGIHQPFSAISEDEDFAAPLMERRAGDLIEFTYRELCFNIDCFYGRPGMEYIHEELLASGLDEILSRDYADVKSLLLSADFNEYFTGLTLLLHGLLSDGGHTNVLSGVMNEDKEMIANAVSLLLEKEYCADFVACLMREYLAMAMDNTREAVYEGDYYAEQGDTAMIRLDEFYVDSDAWSAYYAGEGELPLGDDALGTVYAGLRRAEANPAIQNVVIDLSCNGGGTVAAVLAVEWLLTGQNGICFENMHSGQAETVSGVLDANFDGVFDAKDKPFSRFRYGVLISAYSFSGGNAFPFFMRENGAMILGQRSGGGACGIRISTAGGVEISFSDAGTRIVDKNGESVDTGCPVDAELYRAPENEESSGYELFYDLAALSDAMNAFFDAAELEPAA